MCSNKPLQVLPINLSSCKHFCGNRNVGWLQELGFMSLLPQGHAFKHYFTTGLKGISLTYNFNTLPKGVQIIPIIHTNLCTLFSNLSHHLCKFVFLNIPILKSHAYKTSKGPLYDGDLPGDVVTYSVTWRVEVRTWIATVYLQLHPNKLSDNTAQIFVHVRSLQTSPKE
jgi:hypothetical protein